MEHRCSRRIPLNINALIYRHGAPVAMGRIKNASGHGLYLETDYHNVRKWQKLELEVFLGRRIKGKERCQVSALVARKSPSGYGLDLEMRNDESCHALLAYIEHRQLDQHRQNRDLMADTSARARRPGRR